MSRVSVLVGLFRSVPAKECAASCIRHQFGVKRRSGHPRVIDAVCSEQSVSGEAGLCMRQQLERVLTER